MNNTISSRQIVLLVFIAVTTTYSIIDMPKFMAQSFGRSCWLPILIGSIVFSAAILVILKLGSMYEQKVFFDYTRVIAGKAVACALALFYVVYFLIIEVNLNVRLVGILSSNFFPKTPIYVFLIISIGLSAFFASKGLGNICRLIEFTGIAFLIATLIICLFMIISGDVRNVLPFFNMKDFSNLKESAKDVILPFAGVEILMLVPISKEHKGIAKKLVITMLLVGVLYVLMIMGTIKILGINNTRLLNDAFFEAVKATPAPVIERLDVIYITFGLSSLFTGFGIVFAAVIEHACSVFKKVKRNVIITITSAIVFALSVWGVKTEMTELSRNIISLLVVIGVFVIPVILLLIAKSKRCNSEKSI